MLGAPIRILLFDALENRPTVEPPSRLRYCAKLGRLADALVPELHFLTTL